jgi:hypothetical protein
MNLVKINFFILKVERTLKITSVELHFKTDSTKDFTQVMTNDFTQYNEQKKHMI